MLLFYALPIILHTSLKCSAVVIGQPDYAPASQCTIGRPANCLELQFMGQTSSGVYTIYPRVWYKILPFKVYCDMFTDGGGWTVFQRRAPSTDHISFYRPWRDYKQGFGDLSKEFWLGNDHLYLLTNQDQVNLRIDMISSENNATYATYGLFQVGNEATGYKAMAGGFAGETATVPGDSFGDVNNLRFVTYDKDNNNTCATRYKGGWWYGSCHSSNLNGLYLNGIHKSYATGINWEAWSSYHYSMQWTEMKIRPKFS